MGRSRVKLNYPGFTALRRSRGLSVSINAEAEGIAERANSIAAGECEHPEHAGFAWRPAMDTDIGQVALATTGDGDIGVIAHNAKHNTLAKALGGGR